VGPVLDAYALIALLADEPAAETVEELLRQGTATITSINLAEALDVLERRDRIPEEELRKMLNGLPLRVVPASESDAWAAARLRARHYHRRTRAVSIADCFLIAAAGDGDAVATADQSVLETARAEGVGTLDLS
jgi:uncharacterized protein with PIN domain